MQKTIAAIAAAGLVVLLGIVWWVNRAPADRFAACREASAGSGAAAIGGPFELTDENGKPTSDTQLITKPTLLYFGYTFCPDVCPLDNARNAEALDILQKKGYDAQMAFISVDPHRDTPDRLRDFTDFIHPDMIGLTGTPEQIQAAAKAYKVYYKKEPSDDPDYYLIDHSTFTYLVLPKTGFVDYFKRDVTPADMASRTACFIDAAS